VTLVRLTDDNLTYLKRFLREAHPTARPSHVAEALAQAFGRATYAAVLADVKAQALSEAPLARFDGNAFARRLEVLSEVPVAPFPLGRPNLPDPCWMEFAERNLQTNDAWYAICRAENLPNVCIRVRRKYAEFAWDCISLDPRYEHATHGKSGSAMGKRMFDLFQSRARGRPGRPIYFGSAFVGTVDPLDLDVARLLADDYFELLYEVTRVMKAAA
jgi:hypothetical protein